MQLLRILSKLKAPLAIRRYAVLRHIFDESWYLTRNADVKAAKIDPFSHFIRYGWAEGRMPNPAFSCDRLTLPNGARVQNPTLAALAQHISQNKNLFLEYDNRQRVLAAAAATAEHLVIFFNVARDLIGGGMLSINRFVLNTQSLFADTNHTQVVVSGVPLDLAAVTHSFFTAAGPQIGFSYLAQAARAEDVWLCIPEVFSIEFSSMLTPFEREWLLSRRSLTIVILNQNNDLMPDPQQLQAAFFPLSAKIIVTTAHSRYCTQRLSSRYGVPFKQLTPFLPSVTRRAWHEKERLIMLSPDRIENGDCEREEVVTALRAALPDFEFVTVSGLSLDEYLDLASRAMFSLTFGEGLDGYFIEPVLGGGVSFAVFNATFFPERFQEAKTLYLCWRELLTQMPRLVRELSLSAVAYTAQAEALHELVASEYAHEKSIRELERLFEGAVDYVPGPAYEVAENDANIKRELELNHRFRFFNLEGEAKSVLTPDGIFLRHLGGEFYSVLYEVYVRRDYDFRVDPACEYVLVDIGCNFGLVSIYLTKRFSNIVKSYAYEPANPTARLALKNFEYNQPMPPVIFKQIGLSDRFNFKRLEFIPDWSTAFSTDDEALMPYMRQTTSLTRQDCYEIEVEIVPASVEFSTIIEENPDKKILLKCDTQGSEFAIFADLAATGMLSSIDQVIVESHFRDPSELISTLKEAGFHVNARLDSAANQVYTLTAHRLSQEIHSHSSMTSLVES